MGPRILILGGYGNFGKRVARALTKQGLGVVIAGRDRRRADAFVAEMPAGLAEAAAFDATRDLPQRLAALRPAAVINTCGPFQTSDHAIAEACIDAGLHYIDLADGRDFVTGIAALDERARRADVAVVAGASSVPGLSSAVIEHYRGAFSELHSLRYGIAPGQKSERGLATTLAVLSYAGQRLRAIPGANRPSYGWQDIHRQKLPGLGRRWMANCDIPDLDLFPPRYGLKSIRFSAGLELTPLHLGLWALSWCVRIGLPLDLPRHAERLLRWSKVFDRFGSGDGGMFMILEGLGLDGRMARRSWYIVARNGEGPQIPTIPAIVLARRAASGRLAFRGAGACLGLVSLAECLDALRDFPVETFSELET